MLKPKSSWFVSRDRGRCKLAFRRPVRLHAERLEDRMMMSANASANLVEAPPLEVEKLMLASGNRQPNAAQARTDGTVSLTATNVYDSTRPDVSERFHTADEFRSWLIQVATAQWGHLFGQPTYLNGYGGYWNYYDVATTLRVASAMNAVDATTSSTNVQVAGVDEADLVETDGNYLYIVSKQDLVIVRLGEGGDLEIKSRLHFEDTPVGMYLSGDRLAIVSSTIGASSYCGLGRVFSLAIDDQFRVDTQETGKPVEAKGPTTTISVLDLTDRSAPTLVQRAEMDGQLVTSRMVDGELRLVLSNGLDLPMPVAKLVGDDTFSESWQTNPYFGKFTGNVALAAPSVLRTNGVADIAIDDIRWPFWYGPDAVYETLEEYVARISSDVLGSAGPRFRILAADGTVVSDQLLAEATDIYRPDDMSARQLTSIVTFDLNSNTAGPVATSSVLTNYAPMVYATSESIYLFAEKFHGFGDTNFVFSAAAPQTNVWQFKFGNDDHAIELAAEGAFAGTLLNQFAIDEHDGYLRVVTTVAETNGVSESVLILKANHKRFEVVGSVGGIAPDESLYSVRFIGDRVFFVTFHRIDPLFAVDLSDPLHPQLMGELQIPGYSEYLQPIDDTHLLAIGRNVAPWGGGLEEPDSLQVSLFDVSNMASPQLVDRYTFNGGAATTTPATGSPFRNASDDDHHAVSYFSDVQIFALPIQTQQDIWWGNTDGKVFEPGEGGLQVFRIDASAGFISLGIIEHDSPIERSVRVGDRLYAISSESVSVHSLANPATEYGRINIAASEGNQPIELRMHSRPELSVVKSTVAVVDDANRDNVSNTEAVDQAGARTKGLRAGWMLPVAVLPKHVQPVRAFMSESTITTGRLDSELLQLLAVDGITANATSDSSIHLELPAVTEVAGGEAEISWSQLDASVTQLLLN